MKKISILTLIAGCLLFFCQKAHAQLPPLYSQYMFMPMVINPAYAGFNDMASATISGRAQWVGVKGAPTVGTANFHTSLPIDKMGMGVTLSNLSYGTNNDFSASLAYSYRVNVGDNKLSMGVQGELISAIVDYTQLNQVPGPSDAVLDQESRTSDTKPNFGMGIMYATQNYYLGLSVPRILSAEVDDGTIDEVEEGEDEETGLTYAQFINLSGAYVLELANQLKVKPSIMLRYVPDGPLNFDLNGEVLLNEAIWAGLSLRFSGTGDPLNSMVVMGQFQINDYLKAGYAFDLPFSSALIRAGFAGSHEIMVNLNFELFDQHAVQTIYF